MEAPLKGVECGIRRHTVDQMPHRAARVGLPGVRADLARQSRELIQELVLR
jgi:hypothetical protein